MTYSLLCFCAFQIMNGISGPDSADGYGDGVILAPSFGGVGEVCTFPYDTSSRPHRPLNGRLRGKFVRE